MKTRFPSLAAAALLLVSLAAASPAPAALPGWLTSVDEAIAAARDGDRYILVDLYAEWCGWCKVLEAEVFPTPEFREFTKDFVLLHVDVDDGGEGTRLQARFEATSLPTTLILDSRMVKVGEVRGFAPTADFLASIRREIEEFDTMRELYDKVLRGDDVALQRQLAEDFHGRGDGARAAALYEAILARVDAGTEAAAWLYYLAADAYRLGGDYDRAAASRKRGREMARDLRDAALIERLDLLRFHIAQDAGDCGEAVASLERFLESHPKSGFQAQARRTLSAIQRGDTMECT